MKTELVTAIMTSSVITVNINDQIRDVKKKFAKGSIRHLPVMDGNKLVGMISKNDIMRLSFGSVFENQESADDTILDMLSIEQVMTHKPEVISPDATVKDVAEIFAKSHFHSLPVMEHDKIVGIVTSTDVIKYLLAQY
jgi:CBS domain-containing protein